jgi:hypothetical protein
MKSELSVACGALEPPSIFANVGTLIDCRTVS